MNGHAVRSWGQLGASSSDYTTVKNLVAALLIGLLLTTASRARSVDGFTKPSTVKQWIVLATIGVVGGSLPFLMFFEGLARASSSQAAFLHKTLLIWVVVLAVPILKERLSVAHVLALGLLVWGQVTLAGGLEDVGLSGGEMLILGAAVLWSIEIVIVKVALRELSPLTLGAARMGVGSVILVSYAVVTDAWSALGALGPQQWMWVLITGVVLAGYVSTWYSALARAPAIDVTAVLVFGAVVTAGLAAGFGGLDLLPRVPGLLLVTVGVLVFVVHERSDSPRLWQ